MLNKTKILTNAMDLLLWFLLGAFCLLYSIFGPDFAEAHIQFSLLNFPIFIGEILLAICIILLLIRWRIEPIQFNEWHYLLFVYVTWLVIKALWGYFTFGPLSFRNAALFYYPLFAVISYSFFKAELFSQKNILGLLMFLFIVKMTLSFPYSLYPSFALFVLLALKINNRVVQCIAFLFIIYFFPYKEFLVDSKSYVLGNTIAFLFLIFTFVFGICKIERSYKIILGVLISALLIFGLVKYVCVGKLKSLVTLKEVIELFQEADQYVQSQKDSFTPKELSVSLYNPQKLGIYGNIFINTQRRFGQKDSDEINSKTEIINAINNQFKFIRVGALYSLREVKEEVSLSLKGTISSPNIQKREIASLEKITEIVIRQVLAVVEQQQQVVLKRTIALYYEQQKKGVPFSKIKEELLNIIDTSPVEEPIAQAIKKGVRKIYLEKARYLKGIIDFQEAKKETVYVLPNLVENTLMKSPTVSPNDEKQLKTQAHEVAYASEYTSSVKGQQEAIPPDHTVQQTVSPETAAIEKNQVSPPANHQGQQDVVSPANQVQQAISPEVPPTVEETQKVISENKDIMKAITSHEEDAVARTKDMRVKTEIALNRVANMMKTDKDAITVRIKPPRNLNTDYSNILFRLFVWKDMLTEFWQEKAILGINFGKPQRSISNEILNVAMGEWTRDGWITPHNSYLNLIYRGGIVGMSLIVGIFFIFVQLVKQFIESKSVIGIILTSILLYWMIIANSLVFLELPYHAIPFWTLLGMVIAYCKRLRSESILNQMSIK